jgi:hypothetical protein
VGRAPGRSPPTARKGVPRVEAALARDEIARVVDRDVDVAARLGRPLAEIELHVGPHAGPARRCHV